jgi:hypothetical protein
MKLLHYLTLFTATGALLWGCGEDDSPGPLEYGSSGVGAGYGIGAGGAAGIVVPGSGTGGSTVAGTIGTTTGGTSAISTGGAGGTRQSAGAGGRNSGGAAGGAAGECTDSCPAPKGGLKVGCKKRFMYGVNFAWLNYAADFGGKASWNMKGVDADRATYMASIKDMKDNGVDVIRWWMFPDLRGDGIVLDSSTKSPTGLGKTVLDDVRAALDIAAEQDVHIKLTLFSFNNFNVDNQDSVSTAPIATDDTKRGVLMETVVRPIANAVEASPNKDRMIAWDVINEPEWAIKKDKDPYGDPEFDGSMSNMNFVSFAQMETFIKDVVTVLKAESTAPVTVGSAAIKWAKAWSKVGLDYHDFHWYGWVDQWYPHTKTPAEYGVDDKPVVVGEFPLIPNGDTTGQAFGGIGYSKLIDDFFAAGYAGALGWAVNEGSANAAAFSWAPSKANVKAWADAHPCYTHY